VQVDPPATFRPSCRLFKPLKLRVERYILPIPPPPAVFDQCMIDVRAIRQKSIVKDASVLVLAASLERHVFPKDQG